MLIKPRSKFAKKLRKLTGSTPRQPDTRIAVWESCKLLYVRNPKCANSSIIGSIKDAQLGRADRADIINLSSEWTSFSFVRNPWARLVSTYQDKASPESAAWRADRLHIQGFLDAGIPIDTEMTFADFCEVVCNLPDDATEKHLRSQTSVLIHRGSPIVSYIGRVENIKEDWRTLMARAGLNIELLHLNKSGGEHYSRYYRDKALVKIVADRYADDIRIFNYDFDMAKL